MPETVTSQPLLPQRQSLVAQTVQSLLGGIHSGHWQEHLPGERELCARLQVGRNTLRAALDELQRKGWLEVVHGQRRRIKARRIWHDTDTPIEVIAVLSPNPLQAMPPPMALIMDTLWETLTKAGVSLELHVNSACFSAKPATALEKLVSDHPATAWILIMSKEPMQRWFVRRPLACLIVGSCVPELPLPSIDVDYRAVCRHAGGLLLRRKHRHIALVLAQGGYVGDEASRQGLLESLDAAHDTHVRVLSHDGTTAHLCAVMDEAMRAPSPPTAYLVARAPHVITVMMHLMRRGKRIPQDVAVISRDDDHSLKSTTPEVSRYTTSAARLAREVARAARQLAETGTLQPKAIRLMPEWISGQTIE